MHNLFEIVVDKHELFNGQWIHVELFVYLISKKCVSVAPKLLGIETVALASTIESISMEMFSKLI